MNQFSSGNDKLLYKKAQRMLEALGALQKAKGVVPISRVHLVSTFASKMGKGGIEIVEGFADEGDFFRVPSTTDPTNIESRYRRELQFSQDIILKQERLNNALLRLGSIPTWSCTPYLDGFAPTFGEHVAWGESSAVIFANSVLGARTNITSVYEDLFAGLTGWVPKYGMHISSERRGIVEVIINLDGDKVTEYESGLIGYWIGTRTENRIPVVTGFPRNAPLSSLISLLAGAAISSSLSLIHIVGVTPEAQTAEAAFQNHVPEEKFTIGPEDIQTAQNELSTAREGIIDGIILGCPHCSMDKLIWISQLVKGKKIKKGILFWIMTTQQAKFMAKQMGIDHIIENTGIKLLDSTCCFHFPPESFGNCEVFMTDSSKGSYLIPSMINKKVIFASTKECIEAAIKGEYSAKR